MAGARQSANGRDRGTALVLPLAGSLAQHLHFLGGDARLDLVPETGRNRYGVPPRPAPHEIWLGSCTASALDAETAQHVFDHCSAKLDQAAGDGTALVAWGNEVRARLGVPYGMDAKQILLTPSGTDAEAVVATIASRLFGPKLIDVLVEPSETGSGVAAAAMSCRAGSVDVRVVAMRDPLGQRRTDAAIIADIHRAAEDARRADAGLVVHLMDVTKTGLTFSDAGQIAAVAAQAPARTLLVIDACQLRCEPAEIADWLAAGCVVQITGSKYAGGPPFCGAVLLPACLCEAVDVEAVCPPGVLLRWEAALRQMETYAQIPLPRRSAILQQFNAHVTDRITVSAPLALIADDDRGAERPARIFTIITGDGSPVRTAALYRNLRVAADGWRSCHVGQPVAIGPKVGLRLCASMPLVSAVDQRWRTSGDLVQAMLPVVTDVDYVVSKWLAVHARG